MKVKFGIIFVSFFLFYSLIIGKAFYVQVVKRAELLSYSERQTVKKKKFYPTRGMITDRNGDPLAVNIRSYSLFAMPNQKDVTKEDLKKLSEIVPELPYIRTSLKLKDRNKFTWLGRHIQLSDDQVAQIKKIDSIRLEKNTSRYYPNQDLAGQLLGFVGIDGQGLSGVEYSLNNDLRGKSQELIYVKDAKGRAISKEAQNTQISTSAINLSIEKDLQEVVETLLKEAVGKHKAKRGGLGVMDPETGEILAIANYPSFNPNEYRDYVKTSRRLNFITDSFEPGSVMKPFTVGAALQKGLVSPDTQIETFKGRLQVADKEIKESFHKEFETMSVSEIIQYSSNVGVTQIAFKLGYQDLMDSFSMFGFGNKSGIEYPGESSGMMEKENNQLRLSNMSFGQGITTTGVQILSSYSIFANGGYYIKPTLIKRKDKKVSKKRVLKREVVDQVNQMMALAVKEGTGTNAQLDPFIIVGKTSTAQRVDEKGGYKGYIPGFVGFPLNVPKKYVIYAYIDNPTEKGYYGNTVAAPMFKDTLSYLLHRDKQYHNVAHLIENKTPNKKRAVAKVEEGILPSFVGLDKESAMKLAEELGLKFETYGFGIVSQQKPLAGEELTKVKNIDLYFMPPVYD